MKDLAAELQAAEDELAALYEERDDLPNKLHSVAARADTQTYMEIKARGEMLPTLITMTRIRVAKLTVERDKAKLEEAQKIMGEMEPNLKDLDEQFDKIRARRDSARQSYNDHNYRRSILETRIDRGEEQIKHLEARFMRRSKAAA